MRNTATFQRKAYPIAVRCLTSILYFFLFSLSSLAACVDKEPVDEEDADPAINPHSSYLEEEESGGNTNSGPAFPVFADNARAFPGAVGYGRNSEGARASNAREVYVVTNTNNSGTGSLRDAVSQPGRIIVFNVAGKIDLNKQVLVFLSNQTVLCQTAPAPGIVLYNGRVSSSGANNVIIRYLRMRAGRQVDGADEIDAGGAAHGHDQIYDHCSFTWATDENFSFNNEKQSKSLYNCTIQNSIIAQGCQNHSCGGLMQTSIDCGITCFRNLLADNKTRNFKVKGLNQYINNVVYNWGNGAAYNAGGDSSGDSNTVIENNYFIKGPAYTWVNTAYPSTTDRTLFEDETKYHFNQISSSGDYLVDTYQQVNPTKPFTGGTGTGTFSSYCIGNFYDEDGEPMTWRTVLDETLRPFAMRMIQRSGDVFIYDLNAIQDTFEPELIHWEGKDAVLGVDAVYKSAKVSFSPYDKTELMKQEVITEGLSPFATDLLVRTDYSVGSDDLMNASEGFYMDLFQSVPGRSAPVRYCG